MNAKSLPPVFTGHLLLADPALRTPDFRRSVILLAEHSPKDGTFGLVLNAPAGQKVKDILTDKKFAPLADVDVYLGGPVQRDQLTFGAFWTRNDAFGFATRISAEEATSYQDQPNTIIKAFAGYSGWEKDQLEAEISQEAWTLAKPTPSLLSRKHDISLWQKTMAEISPYHHILSGMPEEILVN